MIYPVVDYFTGGVSYIALGATGCSPIGELLAPYRSEVKGSEVVAAARRWLNVRYRHQGRNRDGVDCIGLPVCVRQDLDLRPMDAGAYARRTTDSEMLEFCRRNMREVSRANLQPGDILVQMHGVVRHMAIVADYPFGGLSIIHAWLPNRKVAECRLEDEFMRDVRGCFRFPEVTDEQ